MEEFQNPSTPLEDNSMAQTPTQQISVTPQPITEENIKTTQRKKDNKTLIWIIVLLVFIIIGTGVYILYKDGAFTKENTNQEDSGITVVEEKKGDEKIEDTVPKVETKPQLQKFIGKFVTAELPEGWSIKEFTEFYDDEGNQEEPPDKNYKGLASLRIYKGDKKVLQFNPFFGGIGTRDFSGTIYRFKDYSPEWEQEEKDELEKAGATINIIDYTQTSYSEYKILGLTVRRIGKWFFYDHIPTTTTFEYPSTGAILSTFLPCSTQSERVSFSFADDITEPDLLIIDKILESLKPNCIE
ncbi:MAG: hypothetical protein ACOX0R_03830 [Candidatus Dojkabacteria bacterium]